MNSSNTGENSPPVTLDDLLNNLAQMPINSVVDDWTNLRDHLRKELWECFKELRDISPDDANFADKIFNIQKNLENPQTFNDRISEAFNQRLAGSGLELDWNISCGSLDIGKVFTQCRGWIRAWVGEKADSDADEEYCIPDHLILNNMKKLQDAAELKVRCVESINNSTKNSKSSLNVLQKVLGEEIGKISGFIQESAACAQIDQKLKKIIDKLKQLQKGCEILKKLLEKKPQVDADVAQIGDYVEKINKLYRKNFSRLGLKEVLDFIKFQSKGNLNRLRDEVHKIIESERFLGDVVYKKYQLTLLIGLIKEFDNQTGEELKKPIDDFLKKNQLAPEDTFSAHWHIFSSNNEHILPSDIDISDLFKELKEQNIHSRDQRIVTTYRYAEVVAKSGFSVLITGETGTGKEILADFIHKKSNRQGKFIPVNCAGFPQNLIGSELFGYVKGAFTGADNDKEGLFHEANGGTIFLDEIEACPEDVQVQLLRVLNSKGNKPTEREVKRVGGNSLETVNVRIVAATNEKIQDLISQGRFRQDLYYRLAGYELNLPPLRERDNGNDIVLLADEFVRLLNRLEENQHTIKRLDDGVKELLERYSWPGNIRELSNVITQAYINSSMRCRSDRNISVDDLKIGLYKDEHQNFLYQDVQDFTDGKIPENFNLDKHLADVQRKYIELALKVANNNQTAAAVLLYGKGEDGKGKGKQQRLSKTMQRLGISLKETK